MMMKVIIGAIIIVIFTHFLIIGVTCIGKDKTYTNKVLYFVANLIVNVLSAMDMLKDVIGGKSISGTTVMLFIITVMALQRELIPAIQEKHIKIRKWKNNKTIKNVVLFSICALSVLAIPMISGYLSRYLSDKINVDNEWIGFLGDYFGAIIGALLSGIVALYVMHNELLQGKKEKKEQEISKIIDYLIEHSAWIIERVENMSYCAIEAVDLSKDDEMDMPMINKFLSAKRLARTAVFDVWAQLELKKDDKFYMNDKTSTVHQKADQLFDDLSDYEVFVLKAKEVDDEMMERNGQIFDLTNELCDAIQEYVKELSKAN